MKFTNPASGAFLALLATLFARELRPAETAAPAAFALSSPIDYQVHQRVSRTEGTITIAGSLPKSSERPSTLEARLAGASVAGDWRELAAIPTGATEFRADLKAPSGGWFRLDVRVRQDQATIAETAVEHVGVGEVFVIAGQSNSANHGEERQQSKSGLAATFHEGKWRLAHDPQPGASGGGGSFIPSFADAMVERFHVPVGIIATGVGATSVREWLPRGTRFPNPPTLTSNVTPLPAGDWQSNGNIFENLVARMKEAGPRGSDSHFEPFGVPPLGGPAGEAVENRLKAELHTKSHSANNQHEHCCPRGFRAVLWHQGESDANQRDASRTLSGTLYEKFLEQLIRDSRRAVGWDVPWFVAKASYHTPDDTGSPEIRAAQEALWKPGVALEGPDTDAMTGDLRDGGGRGVHFSGKGLLEHGTRWAAKVAPWLEQQFASAAQSATPPEPKPKPNASAAPSRLAMPDTENFTLAGRPAFLFLPPAEKRDRGIPQPWIFYAPTLPPYPDQAERWMHEQFLAAGVAVAGIDAGEAYGSPKSHALFDALYRELTEKRGFAARPCLFGRSRGGLWVSSWAVANPARISGLIGIYPVFDFRTYPGLKNAAPAYDLTPTELESRVAEFNPIARIEVLARAGVPAMLIHGDIDKVVPLAENSAEFARRYQAAGAGTLVKLIVIEGQGHNFFEGFFRSRELVDFAIERARAGAKP